MAVGRAHSWAHFPALGGPHSILECRNQPRGKSGMLWATPQILTLRDLWEIQIPTSSLGYVSTGPRLV